MKKHTWNQAIEKGEVWREYYEPSGTMEWYDGETFYNKSGDPLRDPKEYDVYSEGYTPFGDE
jgi:hypothetical protein